MSVLLHAALKGVLEGVTEFLPISSTGHLILVRELLPLTASADPAERARLDGLFDIVVQFPAILAVALLYRTRLRAAFGGAIRPGPERKFCLGLLAAFLPAMVFGVLLHDLFERKLYHALPVALALIAGGVVLLLVDRRRGDAASCATPPVERAEDVSLKVALQIGIFQCLAMIPGTSRSGATIIGGRLLGLSREAAAEYSFFLALPTLAAAFAFKFAQAFPTIRWESDGPILLTGCVASFLTAAAVVTLFVRFLQRHGLGVFGWYRIALGALVLWLAR